MIICFAFDVKVVHVSIESMVSDVDVDVVSTTAISIAPFPVIKVEVYLKEPLEKFLDRTKRRRIRQILGSELFQLIRKGLVSTRGPYNLFDRIVDNLTIECSSVRVHFQAYGAFKTRSIGPWTPPALQMTAASIRLCSVNEFGCEGSPDEVWRHNHHSHKSFMIYKKLEMEYQLSIVPHGCDPIPLVMGRDNRMTIQMAFERRLRDGAILAIQIDTTCPKVEIDIPALAVAPLYHAMTGVQYCLSKDRAFIDPLKQSAVRDEDESGVTTSLEGEDDAPNSITFTSSGESFVDDDDDDNDVEVLGAANLPITVEEVCSSSSSGDEDDSAKREQEEDQGTAAKRNQPSTMQNAPTQAPTTPTPTVQVPTATASAFAPPDRPVILLPNGIVIHEKLSLSISVHDATIRGTYEILPQERQQQNGDTFNNESNDLIDGYIQCVAKGFTGEVIWPKTGQEMGGYAQVSVSYLSVQEKHGSRIRTLLVGGAQHDSGGPVESATPPRPLVNRDETFPMYEDRSVRPDPLGMRYTFPEQAFGVKSTISFQPKPFSTVDSSKQKEDEIHVLHEVGIEQFDIVLDSHSWCRALRFAINQHNGGFDPRWHSGDWCDHITPNMLVKLNVPLNLVECVQPTKQLFLDQNDFPSSDLFNVTARVKNVDIRVPAAILDDVRSCDILISLDESMLMVSSALPRTFLSGKIGNSVNGDDVKTKGVIDFPNDPSDVAYVLEQSEDPSDRQRGVMTSRPISTFRLQLTLRRLDVRLVPIIPIGISREPQQLLAPAELTMIVCFEGEPPESPDSNLTKIVLFTSVQAHRFDINFDFDLATAAIGTLAHHVKVLHSTVSACLMTLRASKPGGGGDSYHLDHPDNCGAGKSRIRKSLEGRKILVRRQIHQSRATGGLSIAFCIQVAGVRFTLWRQNVPYSGPLRSHTVSKSGLSDHRNARMPLVKLMRCDLGELEIGIEATLRRESRRMVLKGCLSSAELSACDFTRMQNEPSAWVRPIPEVEGESKDSEATYGDPGIDYCSGGDFVQILLIGGGSGTSNAHCPDASNSSVSVRIEEQKETDRSWSFAMDAPNGACISCQIEAIEALVLLVFEALLMPAWAKDGTVPSNARHESWAFPVGSVGALFLSLLKLPVRNTDFSTIDIRIPVGAKSKQVPGGLADSLLRDIIDKAIPKNVSHLFVRYNGSDLLVKVPKDGILTECFGLLVEECSFLVSYISTDAPNTEMMEVLGRTGEKWSTLVPSDDPGLRHSLQSRQKLVSCGMEKDTPFTEETLVESFECGYVYAKSKANFSLADGVVVGDVEKLDFFLARLQTFAQSCSEILGNMQHIVSTVRRPENPEVSERTEDVLNNPVTLACTSTAEAISSARDTFRIAKDEFAELHTKLKALLRRRELEIMQIRRVVFQKEKERLSAAALVSSAATGWLRFGSPQRTGQRGIMTSNLWPKWAKLRHSLLILYPSPSSVSFEQSCSAQCFLRHRVSHLIFCVEYSY